MSPIIIYCDVLGIIILYSYVCQQCLGLPQGIILLASSKQHSREILLSIYNHIWSSSRTIQ